MDKLKKGVEKLEKKLHGYEFYKKIGSPQYVCGPMVDQSELSFRMLCRKYGTTLAYTPMIHSKLLTEKGLAYLSSVFTTVDEDRPLIAQFCGNDPDTVLKACRYVEDKVDAIDLNFGCPQGIAKKGRYGAYLLAESDTIVSIVKKLHEELSVPVTCKIRILPNKQKTLDLAKQIEEAGCSILTVHGRMKEQNKDTVGLCDWDIIKEIKELLTIPVIANGGIYTFEDVERCLEYTGVDGVMSAEGLLENPALFSGNIHDLDELALEYLTLAEKYSTPHFFVKAHLFKILHQGLQQHTDLRSRLATLHSISEHREMALELQRRRSSLSKEDKFGWYMRYWGKLGVDKSKYNQALINNEGNKNECASRIKVGESMVLSDELVQENKNEYEREQE